MVRWTEEQKQYLKSIITGITVREATKMMNEKFDREFTVEAVKQALTRYNLRTGNTGRFEEGHVPWNKGTKGICKARRTSFKKGNIPPCYMKVGSEVINSDGYWKVKVADPNKWELKHRIIYQEAYGPIPKNCCIIFADKNKLNLDLDNLILITKKELLIMNNNKLINENKEITKTGTLIAKIQSKLLDLKK